MRLGDLGSGLSEAWPYWSRRLSISGDIIKLAGCRTPSKAVARNKLVRNTYKFVLGCWEYELFGNPEQFFRGAW